MTAEKSPPALTATLADWVRDARQRTLELVSDLTDEQLTGPRFIALSPLLWEIGHIGWLQEKWLFRRNGEPSMLPNSDSLYDADRVPHVQRWNLPLPSREETLRYLQAVEERILEWLQQGPNADEVDRARQAVLQEDFRGEALLQARQTLAYPAPRLSWVSEPSAPAGAWPGDADVPGGSFPLGVTADELSVPESEERVHPVEVGPFRIAKAPVTQGEYAAFVERGGYYRPELWSADGWRWRQATDARHPVYWKRASNWVWLRRQFDQWVQLEPHRPMVHVSWYEAEAYCRWVNRRLPTEVEWEVAAAGASAPTGGLAPGKRRFPWGDAPPEPDHAHLDGRCLGCADVAAYPAGDSAFACRQMIGNVWEWTASDFPPSPGSLPADPAAVPGKVLRGGSWATRARLVLVTRRRHAMPSRSDLAAGFRTCAR